MRLLSGKMLCVLALLYVTFMACNTEHPCASFENPDDLNLSFVNTVGCENGERLLMMKARYNGTNPVEFSWEWEVGDFSSETNQIKLVGDEEMMGFVKFKNEVSGCYIYKPVDIPAGSPSSGMIGNTVWKDSSTGMANQFDPSDEPLSDIIVELLSGDDGSLIAQDTTDEYGRYLFTELPEDIYMIHVIKPDHLSFVPKNAISDRMEDSDVDAQGYSDALDLGCCDVRLDIDAGLR